MMRGRAPRRTALRWMGALCGSLAAVAAAPVRGESPAARPPVGVETSVDPSSVTIGTPLRYTLRLTADAETELVVPALAGQIGAFQVVDFGGAPPRDEGGQVVVEHWFTLVTYDVGDHIVPGPTVQYRVPGGELQSVAAPDAIVIVQSLVAAAGATPANDVRDIKGPVAVPRDYRPLLWIGAALVLLLGLVAWLYHWLNRPRRTVLPPARPAHEVALEALSRLHVAHLLETGRQEEFYVRLSAIVREYLESRFHVRAPEMTTEEFLPAAQRNPQLSNPQRSLLAHFLAEADLVKFARHHPAVPDAERAYMAAREFVHSTAPEVARAVA